MLFSLLVFDLAILNIDRIYHSSYQSLYPQQFLDLLKLNVFYFYQFFQTDSKYPFYKSIANWYRHYFINNLFISITSIVLYVLTTMKQMQMANIISQLQNVCINSEKVCVTHVLSLIRIDCRLRQFSKSKLFFFILRRDTFKSRIF